MNFPLWICILILFFLMIITVVELYFIFKRILLNYEFKKQKIKDKKYASTLYRFYIYSKYHTTDTIVDFAADFENFYQDESTQEFNINKTISFDRDISSLNYKKQLNANNSINLQNNVVNNQQQNNVVNNQQQNNVVSNQEQQNNVVNNKKQQNNTIINNQMNQKEETFEKKPSSNINIKVASSKNNSSTLAKTNEASKTKKEEIVRKKDKNKEKNKDKNKEKDTDSSVYFNEDKSTGKVKQSKKEIKSAAKDKEEKDSIKKLMSDI